MNIFDHAMQMEKDGEKLYRDLAQKSENIGIKNIFNMLADDEVKHYKVFEDMKKNEKSQMADTEVLASAKNVFTQLKKEKTFDQKGTQLDLYKKAQELEKKSEEFYLQKAEEVKDSYQKEIMLKIAEEEKKHYFLLDNIVQFVSAPERWLEDAEFSYFDEYFK